MALISQIHIDTYVLLFILNFFFNLLNINFFSDLPSLFLHDTLLSSYFLYHHHFPPPPWRPSSCSHSSHSPLIHFCYFPPQNCPLSRYFLQQWRSLPPPSPQISYQPQPQHSHHPILVSISSLNPFSTFSSFHTLILESSKNCFSLKFLRLKVA